MEQETLTKLIERARQGDQDAQNRLVQMAQNRIYYHCKKMLKKEEDAQDATQDVLISMLTGLDKLRHPEAFWGWVNGITANRCRHLLSAPHREWQIPEDEEGGSMLDDLESLDETLVPEKALDNEETRRMILGLVDDLPPEQRLSVLFYYYDEMSVRDIAQAMEVSEGTVKSRLNYARKTIKKGVEDYERKGIKLYGVSPILLLVYFLRQEAASCTLEGAAAAAVAGQALAQAGAGAAAEGTAATAAAAESTAAATAAEGTVAAATAGGGTAATAAAAGLSVKVVAGVVAGVLLVGGAVGAATLGNRGGGEPPASSWEESYQQEVVQTDDDSFGALHGFTLVEPRAYEDLPLTMSAQDPNLVLRSSSSHLDRPAITVSQPDEEGYVTYTAHYAVTAQALIEAADGASMAFSIFAQDYNLFDWYTGRLYFPDERADEGEEARAVGSAQVTYHGESVPVTYEKRWTSGISSGGGTGGQSGGAREIPVEAFQEVTFSIRVPQGYDGVLLGVNVVDPADPEKQLQEEWNLETDDPAHYEFVRLSDWAEAAQAEGVSQEEAYAAYLAELEEQEELIDAYVSWYEGVAEIRPVAVADVWGDSTPELFYVAADEAHPYAASWLNILTWQDGQLVPLLRESWDFFAGSNLSYTVFQAEDGALWADTSYFASSRVTQRYAIREEGGALTLLPAEELPAPARVLLSNQESAPEAMTRTEAESLLREREGA